MVLVLWVALMVAVAALAYIRLAPSPPDIWHKVPDFSENRNMKGGVVRIVDTGNDGLARLDAIARSAPRTQVLAGSVDAGMVTYVTRTRVFGFPDYTTAHQDGGRLVIWARLRFGGSDFGVNRHRVETWLAALQAR